MGKEEEGIIVQIRREDGGEWKGRENEKSRAGVKNKPPFSMATSTTRIGQIAPTQTQGVAAIVSRKRTTGQFSNKLWKYLFLAHLLTIAILITVLSVIGFLAAGKRKFHPIHWYPPILTSYACSTLVAIAWLSTTLNYPLKALKASLWLAPLLTFALAIFLLYTTSTGFGLAFGVLALIFSPIQCFYGCWASPRLNYTSQILTTSIFTTTQVTLRIAKFIAIALIAGVIYSSFWTLAVGGVTAGAPRLAPLYIFILLLSLAWTMQVIRNTVQVAIGRVAYMNLAHGVAADVPEAFRDACTGAMGDICLGSAVVPTVGAFRGVARAMNQVAGDHDEFLFSCANCYKGLADWLVAFGNRWGFVRVGSHDRGFVEASRETWEMFTRLAGMERAVDSDLTSSFCFLCGVAGAALCGLAAGIWVVIVDKSYVTGVTVYAFIIGYLMSQIAVSWPQACVSAYHVAYSETPQNLRLGTLLHDRIQALQSS